MTDLFVWKCEYDVYNPFVFFIARIKEGDTIAYEEDIIPCWGGVLVPRMYEPVAKISSFNGIFDHCGATEENLKLMAADLKLTPFQMAKIKKVMRGLGAPASR